MASIYRRSDFFLAELWCRLNANQPPFDALRERERKHLMNEIEDVVEDSEFIGDRWIKKQKGQKLKLPELSPARALRKDRGREKGSEKFVDEQCQWIEDK